MKLYLLVSISIFLFISCKKQDIPTPNPPPAEQPPSKIPKLITNEIANQSVYSTVLSGKIVDTVGSKITEVGIVVDTAAQPTLTKNFNKFPLTADSAGNFFAIVTNIPAGVTFYVRAYGINSYGTGYGNQIVFTALTPKTYFGNVTLTSQKEVDAFGAENYSVIDGSLEIENNSVKSIASLKSLVLINYGLYIKNTSLIELSGLDSLKEIGIKWPTDLWIEGNSKLVNFKGLSGLRQIHGDFHIFSNDALVTMDGIDNLTAVGAGNLKILNCRKLANLNGLNNLQFIGGDFWIGDNASLKNVQALSNVNYIGLKLYIFNNSALVNLDGLEKIQTLHDGLDIEDNKSLSDIKGIANLSAVDVSQGVGFIKITNSPLLTDLSALNNITESTGIFLSNLSIKDLTGLKNLENVKVIELDGLNGLTDLSGLEKIKTANTITISSNNSLLSLSGLEKIKTATTINIGSNNSLLSLKGLEGLNTLSGSIYTSLGISNNSKLQSLEGLENIIYADGGIYISNNISLTSFCAIKPLFVAGFDNTFSTTSNGVNPDKNTVLTTCP